MSSPVQSDPRKRRDPSCGDAENNLPQIPLHSGGTITDHVRGIFNDGPRQTGSSLLALLCWVTWTPGRYTLLALQKRAKREGDTLNVTSDRFSLLFQVFLFLFLPLSSSVLLSGS